MWRRANNAAMHLPLIGANLPPPRSPLRPVIPIQPALIPEENDVAIDAARESTSSDSEESDSLDSEESDGDNDPPQHIVEPVPAGIAILYITSITVELILINIDKINELIVL